MENRLIVLTVLILLLTMVPMDENEKKVDARPIRFHPGDLDLDGDLVDDRMAHLDPNLAFREGRMGMNVHLRDGAGDASADEVLSILRGRGADPILHRRGTLIDVLYITISERSAEHSPWTELGDDVAFVELRPPFVPMLDTSTGTIRGRSSEEYSPETVDDLGMDGAGINIAVLDTGVDNTLHESFRGRAEYGVDFTGATFVTGLDPDDIDGHGTHVAGIALGTGGSSGTYRGVAPGSGLVDLRIARITGDITGNLDSALEWLIENHEEHDIRVVSISFGSTYNSPGTDTTSLLANRLVDEGVVVVVAAGNSGIQGLPSPAAADRVITVASVNDRGTVDRRDDSYDTFSNRGPRDSDGDGDRMDELKPDLMAPGRDIMSALYNSLSGYISQTGTSMSCPHVSGIVALMLQANPGLNPEMVKDILRNTAEQTFQPYDVSLDPKYNSRSGWGSVDAYGAVKRALDLGSVNIMGPDRIGAGTVFGLDYRFNYSRTDYVQGVESAGLRIRTPGTIGPPELVDVDPGSAIVRSSTRGPYSDGADWVIDVEFLFNSTPMDLGPLVMIELGSPSTVGTSLVVSGALTIQGAITTTAEMTIEVVENSGVPDLSITPFAIWFSEQVVEGGESIGITVRVNNTGQGLAKGCTIRIIDGPQRTGEVIGEAIRDIPAGGHTILTVQWEANPGIHAITAVADPEDAIDESNEFNNSAERPLTVLGLNPPPVAQLTADTNRTVVLSYVVFDASGSYDTNLRGGNVVSYRFRFGDGGQTGWVNESRVQHAYAEAGTYIASVEVRDNGGAESANDATFTVDVLDLTLSESVLYLDGSYILAGSPPSGGSIELQQGEGARTGTFSSAPFDRRTILSARVEVILSVAGNHTEIEFEVRVSAGPSSVGSAVTGPVISEPEGSTVTIAIPTEDISIGPDEPIYIEVLHSSNGPAHLLLGADGSRVRLYPIIAENKPPVAEAGEDMEIKAGSMASFTGSGSDEDGELISARWDFDGDGSYDAEGLQELSTVYDGFSVEGVFRALLEVRDDDGWWSGDTLTVTVRSSDHNFAPLVTMDCPEGAVLTGVVKVSGTASDDAAVESVEVRLGGSGREWMKASGTERWSLELDTTDLADGETLLSARAFDGERYSEMVSCSVNVSNPAHPPSILSVRVSPTEIPLDGSTSIDIYMSVSDLDLPKDRLEAYLDLSSAGGDPGIPLEELTLDGHEIGFGGIYTPPVDLAPGPHPLRVWVVDSSGLEDEAFRSLDFLVSLDLRIEIDPSVNSGDELLVQVDLGGPRPGFRIVLNSSAIGDGIYELFDDGAQPDRVRSDGTYTARVPIDARPGRYTLTVEVLDGSGATIVSETKEIVVRSSPEGEGSLSTWAIAGIIIVLVMMVIAVCLLLISMRRYNREDVRHIESASSVPASVKIIEAVEVESL